MKRIGIIGAGFSGVVLAAQLLRSSESPLEILLFEKSGEPGVGVAYSTDDPAHLLNVPASKMSAFPDLPSHFAEWLQSDGWDASLDFGLVFPPRMAYRRYLQDVLDQAVTTPKHGNSVLRKIREEVVSIVEGEILTSTRQSFSVDAVVMATGHLAETNMTGKGPISPPYRPDTWGQDPVDEIVLIGSGLTAMDAALTAFSQYPSAHVTVISPSAEMPERYDAEASHLSLPTPEVSTLREILRWVRQEVKAAPWQAVFNSMRPKWEELWQRLSQKDQQRFLRHLRSRFDRYRHRVPPDTADSIAKFLESEALRLIPGTVARIESEGQKKVVIYLQHGISRCLTADLVVDCSGHSHNWAGTRDPLISNLMLTGDLRPGPHGMGVQADATGRVSGVAYPLFAIGPMLKGRRWETTAVAEIRDQAAKLSQHLLSLLAK